MGLIAKNVMGLVRSMLNFKLKIQLLLLQNILSILPDFPGNKILTFVLPVMVEGCRKQSLLFSFTAGDKLSDYYVIDTTTPDPNKIDVHGNQYGLLRSSKCFRLSNTLTCSSCHNTHENEKGKVATFSQRCMNCHDDAHEKMCKLTKSLGAIIKTNCIDCHMPLQSSKAIAVQLHGDSLPTAALIRSHLITVYPDETKKIIDVMKKLKQPH